MEARTAHQFGEINAPRYDATVHPYFTAPTNKVNKTLRVTPAMEAGLTDRVWDMVEVVALIDEAEKPAGQSN